LGLDQGMGLETGLRAELWGCEVIRAGFSHDLIFAGGKCRLDGWAEGWGLDGVCSVIKSEAKNGDLNRFGMGMSR